MLPSACGSLCIKRGARGGACSLLLAAPFEPLTGPLRGVRGALYARSAETAARTARLRPLFLPWTERASDLPCLAPRAPPLWQSLRATLAPFLAAPQVAGEAVFVTAEGSYAPQVRLAGAPRLLTSVRALLGPAGGGGW